MVDESEPCRAPALALQRRVLRRAQLCASSSAAQRDVAICSSVRGIEGRGRCGIFINCFQYCPEHLFSMARFPCPNCVRVAVLLSFANSCRHRLRSCCLSCCRGRSKRATLAANRIRWPRRFMPRMPSSASVAPCLFRFDSCRLMRTRRLALL